MPLYCASIIYASCKIICNTKCLHLIPPQKSSKITRNTILHKCFPLVQFNNFQHSLFKFNYYKILKIQINGSILIKPRKKQQNKLNSKLQ